MREIEEKREIEHDGRSENRITTQEVDFELHRISEPTEDIDVVPTFLRVAARRVILDTYFVEDVLVERGVELGLQDDVESAELRYLLRLEGLGVVEHFAVAVAEDVRRE